METSPALGEAMPKTVQNFTPAPSSTLQAGAPTLGASAVAGASFAAAPTLGASPVAGASFAAAPTAAGAETDSRQPPPPTGPPVYVFASEPHSDTPRLTLFDALYVCILLILGFFFWEWQMLSSYYAGIGTTLFFLLALGASVAYLHQKGMKQNPRSLISLAIALTGALPFFLYGARDFYTLLFFFEIAACLVWVAFTCKTNLSSRLSGLLPLDLLNQSCIVPVANFFKLFSALAEGFGARRKDRGNLPDEQAEAHRRQRRKTVLLTIAVLAVFLPLLALIIVLLASSDNQFSIFLGNVIERLSFLQRLDFNTLLQWVINLILGVPVACYLFGSVYGNLHRNHSDIIKEERVEEVCTQARVLPSVAFAVPLALLVVLYVCYFVVMAPYLFSAFTGVLLNGFTYAEYARRGFFELCGVAIITMLVLCLTWLLVKRIQHGTGRSRAAHPPILRILGGVVSLLTCLLVMTAASKMILYILTYNLSPLRLYTMWFIVLLFLCFLLILLWHARPFNVARPLIITTVILVFALAFTNTDGMIARYNTDRYLSGQTEHIDVALIDSLSDAVLPALYDLESQAVDREVQLEAHDAIMRHTSETTHVGDQGAQWYNWNLISVAAHPTQ